MENKKVVPSCSFCGRPEDLVEKMVSGPSAYICDKCVGLCQDIIKKKPVSKNISILKPKQIKERLDEYIIGQELAKRTMSVGS